MTLHLACNNPCSRGGSYGYGSSGYGGGGGQYNAYPYGKPSYAYLNGYGYGGLSGYEGPPYGRNIYWQPGVAYPPTGLG